MVCNACGRTTQNEEANFCYYCGTSFREHIRAVAVPQPAFVPKPEIHEREAVKQAVIAPAVVVPADKPVPFLNWLSTYGLLFIPYIGLFAFLGMLIYWSTSKDTPVSKKNWARATLIFVPIFLVYLSFSILSMMLNPIFQEYMGSINQLMKGTN